MYSYILLVFLFHPLLKVTVSSTILRMFALSINVGTVVQLRNKQTNLKKKKKEGKEKRRVLDFMRFKS